MITCSPEVVNDIGAFRLDFGIYDQGKCIDSCKSAPVDITYDNHAQRTTVYKTGLQESPNCILRTTSTLIVKQDLPIFAIACMHGWLSF